MAGERTLHPRLLMEMMMRSSGGQSSVDTWVKPKGKWIEVPADYRLLDALVKEENHVDEERQRKRKKRSRTVRHA